MSYSLDLMVAEISQSSYEKGDDAYRRARAALLKAARKDRVLRESWLGAKASLDRRMEEMAEAYEYGRLDVESMAFEKAVYVADWSADVPF